VNGESAICPLSGPKADKLRAAVMTRPAAFSDRSVLVSARSRPVLHSRCSRLVLKTFTDRTLSAH
jgi:hypothetical protein